MSVYVTPTDCDDPAVTVADSHCMEADTLVDAALANLGVSRAELTLPVSALTLLGKYYALAAACREKAKGEASTLLAKATAYEKSAQALAGRLSRELLGVASSATGGASSAGFGTCRVKRGG